MVGGWWLVVACCWLSQFGAWCLIEILVGVREGWLIQGWWAHRDVRVCRDYV